MKILFLITITLFVFSQEILSDFLIVNGDTLDNFVYQIPNQTDQNVPTPLLIVFHQWGGSAISTISTQFDEEAYNRGWYFLSPWGGSSNNYNHQQAQYFWEQEILWLKNRYNIDLHRIYMVGGSMGGASGAIYANNHLDPTKPMVAATASASGILDCERRFYEMNGNNSMIEWFGGTPEEVSFEYHRNSAVFFEDLNQSMHLNLRYTPLYLDFGATEPHRGHGEDLFNLLLGYNQNMWIDVAPSNGHGFSVIDEQNACDWLEQFELVIDPDDIHVNLDEPSRAYWSEALNIQNETSFIQMHTQKEFTDNEGIGLNKKLIIELQKADNTDSLLLHILTEWIDQIHLISNDEIANTMVGLTGSFVQYIESYQIIFGMEFESYVITGEIIWLPLELVNNGENGFSIEFFYSINDINGDANWDITDILLIINFILEFEILTDLQQYFSDLNEDNIINIIDILIIVNIILE